MRITSVTSALLAIVNFHDIAFTEAAERFAGGVRNHFATFRCPEQQQERAAIPLALDLGTSQVRTTKS
jgi:hypothetical protein